MVLLEDGTTSSTVQLDSTDTKWRAYSKGSLGAQSTSALWRRHEVMPRGGVMRPSESLFTDTLRLGGVMEMGFNSVYARIRN